MLSILFLIFQLTLNFITNLGNLLPSIFSMKAKHCIAVIVLLIHPKHGPGTEFLFHLKPGDTVETKGPFGRLILKDTSPKRYILVSTSTGVTPYRAMLSNIDQLLHEDPALEIILLHGVQTRADLIYDHEFLAFAAKHQRFQYKPCLSRQKDDLNKHEYSGYVQHALPKLDLKPLEDIVYLCGNPGMVDEAFQWLKDHEFPVQHIVREKYISR